MMSDAREIIAEAMRRSYFGCGGFFDASREAKVALTALSEAGYVVVPKDDLYTEIQDAYCKAYCDGCERPTCGTGNHMCALFAESRVKAMLSPDPRP